MNFRLLLLLLLIGPLGFCQDTEYTNETDYQPTWWNQNDPETVYLSASISKVFALNDSNLKEFKNFTNADLEFGWYFLPNFILGAYFDKSFSHIKEEHSNKTGAVRNRGFSTYGIQAGYYNAINREWNWSVKFGIGSIIYRSSAAQDIFREKGITYKLDAQVGYRINRTLAFFFKVSPAYDQLSINSTPEYQDYLNKMFRLNAGLGVRVHFQNPNG